MSSAQAKLLKKPPPAPARRQPSTRIAVAAAKKKSAAAASASASTSAAAPKKNPYNVWMRNEKLGIAHKRISRSPDSDVEEEPADTSEYPLTQLSEHEDSTEETNNPPPAAAKRPAIDSNEIAVITPSKPTKKNKVLVKDLRELTRNDDLRMNNLRHYVPDEVANSSDDSSAEISPSPSKSGDNDDKLIGPIFRSWCDRSTINDDFVKAATNFSIAEFRILYFQTADIIQSSWNVGSGRRNPTHPMDALLMTLTQLKQGRPYAHTARVFGCAADRFRRLVETFVVGCADGFVDYFVTQPSMGDYRTSGAVFDHFPDAIEAIDVTFQRSYARGEDYASKKLRWSGKHKGYGWKSEIAVGPDGKARYLSPPYPGSFHDMKIFKKHVDEHLARLVKDDADARESDDMSVDDDDDKNMWAALLDKGYEGSHKYGRFLSPKKKTARRDLDSDDKKKNNRIENDRVIVENFFGRMKTIWGTTEQTFRFRDDLYAPYFKLCVALTNYHIGILPLRKEDGIIESNYYKRMIDEYRRADAKQKANVRAQYETKQARQRLVSELLDDSQEAHDIAGPVEDDPGNPGRVREE